MTHPLRHENPVSVNGTALASAVRVIGAFSLLAALLISASDEPAVPAGLQAELLARLLRHDRQFSAEKGPRVSVLVVHSSEPSSLASARQLVTALGEQEVLGGRPHTESLFALATLDALLEHVTRNEVRLVIFAPGTVSGSTAAKLTRELEGKSVFTVSMTTDGVAAGLMLGFELESGKPRMWLNLQQARRQGADLRAEVVKLMKVVP